MHLVAVDLDLMSPDNRDEVVLAENVLNWFKTEFDRALTLGVSTETA